MLTTTPFFDAATSTFSYIIFDAKSSDALIIDGVLDFELSSACISMSSIERLCAYIQENNLTIRMILDTHVHADHMSAAWHLKKIFKAPRAIGEGFLLSQKYFANFFGFESELLNAEPAYDIYLKDQQELKVGSLTIKTLLTPGHTPSCASFLIEDNLFCGDALFQPELGCGRTDFPGASAEALYRSVKNNIYQQNPNTKLFFGHDYPAAQEYPRATCLVGISKQKNIMLDEHISEADFIKKRTLKDQSLQPPKLLLPAMQVNIFGGKLPQDYLRLPIKYSDSNLRQLK